MKPFHYHEDPMYAAAAAILTQETVSEEAVQLDEGVEDIAAAVANFKKGDKTNFGVVTDVGTNSISFKAKDLPVTKIAFNQRKMGSKDFVLDKLVKLKEGVELEEASDNDKMISFHSTAAKKAYITKNNLASNEYKDYGQAGIRVSAEFVKNENPAAAKDLVYRVSDITGQKKEELESFMKKFNVLDEAANITPVKGKYIFFIEDHELYQLSPYKLLATLKVGRTLEPLMSLVNSGSDWKAVSVARGEDLVEIGALKSPQDSDEVAQWYVVNSIYKGITHLALIH
jgi:hypothetical protein